MRNNRKADDLRAISITPNFIKYPEGSCLIEAGDTRVICAASIEEQVPPFLEGKNQGWLTSEYSMLPRATKTRTRREAQAGKVGGRTQEIQRLIGRALRCAVDLKKLGPRTLYLDCDVIQADGGTRTAAITGSFVALSLAIDKLLKDGLIQSNPIVCQIAAISVGIVKGEILLDLDYKEDSNADVDLNIIMNNEKKFIEVQGTAEKDPAPIEKLNDMIEMGWSGITKLFEIQRSVLNSD